MLIEIDTLSRQDLEEWSHLERYDIALGESTPMARKTLEALELISRYVGTHPDTVCSASWGKDSIVVAHLTRLAAPEIPIMWVPTIRTDGMSYEADATYQVRDRFLSDYPGPYIEQAAIARNPKRGDPDYSPDQFTQPGYQSQDVLKENNTRPYISGVRAEESAIRAGSRRWHGLATKNTCRPIMDWKTTDIFAYIAAHDLPAHPAYAATHGGTLDRRWLRVHPLRSKAPDRSTVYGRDMDGWEDEYFPQLTYHQKYPTGA